MDKKDDQKSSIKDKLNNIKLGLGKLRSIPYSYIFLSVVFTGVYLLGRIPPSEKYNLWILSFVIPIALFLNLSLILVSIVMRKRSGVILVFSLLVGFNYLISSVGLRAFTTGTDGLSEKTFSVLNYNVGFISSDLGGKVSKAVNQPNSGTYSFRNWVLNMKADIQCYQEFHYKPLTDKIDLIDIFQEKGYHYYFSGGEGKSTGSGLGILIATRFPIVSKGDVMVSDNRFNRIAFADVKLRQDTIRIINVHLQSMQIKKFHPGYSRNFEDQARNIKAVLARLKSGVFERSKQISRLIDFIKSSPYPIICVGDFNELPYSYSYQELKKHLYNAFEESGRGFGFTYNGNTVNMLRIDNQFYSGPLKSTNFWTLDTVRFNDHFPLLGTYMLP